eukprot:12880047-Ditylum_brightwellii.AAC.1
MEKQWCLLQFGNHYRLLALLLSFPGFGARRVAAAADDSASSPWWQWQWDNGILLVPVEAHNS